jgi:tripartite-type tricarboxylate transporter receptor subunit TctC
VLKRAEYDVRTAFIPIVQLTTQPYMLVVNPSLPVKSVKELVALAKGKPRGLNYASSGTGTPYHMAGELFKAMAGVDILHVPHKGSGEARTSVMSGQVEMMLDAITTMTPMAKAGRVRALATTGLKRSNVTPDIPTVSEAGVKGYEATIWLGVMAPTGTPRPVVDRLNAELNKVISRPDVKKAWNEQGAEPMAMTPAEFHKYLNDDIAKWARIVKLAGARADQ